MRPYASPRSKLFQAYEAMKKDAVSYDKVVGLVINHDSSKILTATLDVDAYHQFLGDVEKFMAHVNFLRIDMHQVLDMGVYLSENNSDRHYVDDKATFQVGLFIELMLMTDYFHHNSTFYPLRKRPSDETHTPNYWIGNVKHLFSRHFESLNFLGNDNPLRLVPYLHKMPFVDGLHSAAFYAPSMLPPFQNIAWDYFHTNPQLKYYYPSTVQATTHYSRIQHHHFHDFVRDTTLYMLTEDTFTINLRNILMRSIFTMLFWPHPKTAWDDEAQQPVSVHTKFRVLTFSPKKISRVFPSKYYFSPANRFRVRTKKASDDFLLQLNTALPFIRFQFEDPEALFSSENISPKLPVLNTFTLDFKSSNMPFHLEKDEEI